LASAALVWVFYLALEPEVRRTRPQAEISWARLLAGRWRDPLVASHVLLGGLLGVAVVLVKQGETLAAGLLGLPVVFPEAGYLLPLWGHPPATLLLELTSALRQGPLVLLALVLFQKLLRRGWLASAVLVALATLATADWQRAALLTWASRALVAFLVVLALSRWGLLATLALLFFAGVLTGQPISRHLGAWHGGATLTAPAAPSPPAPAAPVLAPPPAGHPIGKRA